MYEYVRYIDILLNNQSVRNSLLRTLSKVIVNLANIYLYLDKSQRRDVEPREKCFEF